MWKLLLVVSQTNKLHGPSIQKFNAKMMRLICTICSKNWTNMMFFLQMTRNLLGVKNTKSFSKEILVLGS